MSQHEDISKVYDLIVIGGGINGAGIAVDAAGRGLKVALLESVDFASGTSSRSSKLVHGGLRYLEYYDFRLVRESLSERERVMKKARHIVWPLRFVMPVVKQSRPAWIVRIGLFFYDHLAPRVTLQGTETVRLSKKTNRMGFREHYDKAFIYSDCWVDDARLVVANLQGAEAEGADILARTPFKNAERDGDNWLVTALDQDSGRTLKLRANVIVNAAGPWAVPIAQSVPGVTTDYSAKLVRGSHIIVPSLYDGDNATMLQIGDGRIVVTMPYENDYTLVGTTDENHPGDPRRVEITDQEQDYLLAAANKFFTRQITADDIHWTYSGVRPLFEEGKSRDDNPTTVTRDYSFKIDQGADGKGAPFLTVLGGKLTTYRRLADHVIEKLKPFLPPDIGPAHTGTSILPGADIGSEGPFAYAETLKLVFPWLPDTLRIRLARTYGSRVEKMLAGVEKLEDLGTVFGGNMTRREVDYLIENEWAASVEDVLWRRTKCGLRFSEDETKALSDYIEKARALTAPKEAAS
ncbi:glycerol-3-phosphate dehydrogenase [Cognatishimia maritima]|uniref:Glycerol-3-phosphate dehydrogenase n=1 Tax=Cognatishimia maritima TaxID=870908 RepID=A0A1M5VKK3_9RHOB|nr:glycerol-3-phosphate dehydrogenase [Cognatishimia maritima]SHH75769.1 glycerol-3-phosphate dehydrogenase [Cognatishimia maritima]